jgi:hypothetical protein
MAISKDLLIIGLLNPRLVKSPKLLPVLDFRVEFGNTFDSKRVRGLYTVCEDITLFVNALPITLTKPKDPLFQPLLFVADESERALGASV